MSEDKKTTVCTKCGKEFDKEGRKLICPDCRLGDSYWVAQYTRRVDQRMAYLRGENK